MKKKQMSKKTRNIIIISALLVVLAGSSAFTYYQFNKTSNDTPNYSSSDTPNKTPAKQTPSKDVNNTKTADKPSSDNTNSKTKETPQYSNQDGSASTSASTSSTGKVSFSAIQNGSNVRVNVTIHQLWSSGTCTLSITNKSTSTSKKAAIQTMPSYSTCQGFSIPVSELGAGVWKINLTVTNVSDNATSHQEVTVQ